MTDSPVVQDVRVMRLYEDTKNLITVTCESEQAAMQLAHSDSLEEFSDMLNRFMKSDDRACIVVLLPGQSIQVIKVNESDQKE